MDLNKENMKKIIILIVVAILVFTGVQNINIVIDVIVSISRLLFPFIFGSCVAFVLNVPMKAIEKHLFGHYTGKHTKFMNKIKRPVSFVLTLVFVLGIISLIVVFISPQLADTIVSIINQIPRSINEVQRWINQMMDEYSWLAEQFGDVRIDWSAISSTAIDFLRNSVGHIFSSTIGITVSIVNGAVTFVLGVIFAVYILFQKEKLSVHVKKLFYAYLKEKHADRIIEVMKMANKTFSRFLAGQCCEAVILGTLFFITLSIFRMPYALLICVVFVALSLLRIVGAFIGCFIGALLILLISPIKALIFVAIFLVLQQIEGNLIYPRVVGGSIGLPAIWVLVAVTVGGSVFGIAGMLIFIPLTSVLYALLREWMNERIKEKKIPKEKYQPKSK